MIDKSNENAKIKDLNKNPLFLNFKRKLQEKVRIQRMVEIVEKTDHKKWKHKEIKNTLNKDYMLLWQQGVDLQTIKEFNIDLGIAENDNKKNTGNFNQFIGIGETAKYLKFWLNSENKMDNVIFELLKKHSQSVLTSLKQQNNVVANAVIFQLYEDILEYLHTRKDLTKHLLSRKKDMSTAITKHFQVAALEYDFILDLLNLKLDAKSMRNQRYEGYFTKFDRYLSKNKNSKNDKNDSNDKDKDKDRRGGQRKEERYYVEITKLERIQSCKLLMRYLEYYQKCLNNDSTNMKERYLFYGPGHMTRPSKIWRSKTGFDISKSKIGKKLWFTSDASYAMSGFEFGKIKQHKIDKVKVMQHQIMLCLCCCSSKDCDSYDDGLIYGFRNDSALYPAYTVSYVVHKSEIWVPID